MQAALLGLPGLVACSQMQQCSMWMGCSHKPALCAFSASKVATGLQPSTSGSNDGPWMDPSRPRVLPRLLTQAKAQPKPTPLLDALKQVQVQGLEIIQQHACFHV